MYWTEVIQTDREGERSFDDALRWQFTSLGTVSLHTISAEASGFIETIWKLQTNHLSPELH